MCWSPQRRSENVLLSVLKADDASASADIHRRLTHTGSLSNHLGSDHTRALHAVAIDEMAQILPPLTSPLLWFFLSKCPAVSLLSHLSVQLVASSSESPLHVSKALWACPPALLALLRVRWLGWEDWPCFEVTYLQGRKSSSETRRILLRITWLKWEGSKLLDQEVSSVSSKVIMLLWASVCFLFGISFFWVFFFRLSLIVLFSACLPHVFHLPL